MTADGDDTILVIGVGNEYRGDDAAGILVARALGRMSAAEVIEFRGDGAGLLACFAGRARVIIADAVHSGRPAGSVVHYALRDSGALPREEMTSTHALGVADALALARALGELPPRVDVWGIEGTDFRVGAEPGPEVQRAAQQVAREIRRAVEGRDEPQENDHA